MRICAFLYSASDKKRANARGYCVAAASSETEMIMTAEATKTFVAPAEYTASPIVNFCRILRTHFSPPTIAHTARRQAFAGLASLCWLTT